MSIYFDGRSQRWIVEISRRVKNTAGEIMRLRRRKTMPTGATQEEAQAVSNRLDSHEFTRALAVDGAEGWDAYIEVQRCDPQSWLQVTLSRSSSR